MPTINMSFARKISLVDDKERIIDNNRESNIFECKIKDTDYTFYYNSDGDPELRYGKIGNDKDLNIGFNILKHPK